MNIVYIYIFVFFIIFLVFNSCQEQETFIDMIPGGIQVKSSHYLNNKSRGLYATKNYKKNEIIEVCPTLIMKKKDISKNNVIMDHFFKGKIGDNELLSLGYCSIINHSKENQNCRWEIGAKDEYIIIKAVKDIKQGEELFSNYGSKYWNSRKKKLKEL